MERWSRLVQQRARDVISSEHARRPARQSNRHTMLRFIALACLAVAAQARTIVVGEGQGGWTLGVDYAPIDAVVGDRLVRIDIHI